MVLGRIKARWHTAQASRHFENQFVRLEAHCPVARRDRADLRLVQSARSLTPPHLRRALGARACQQPRTKEFENGNQEKWLTTLGEGPAEWFTGTVRIDPLFQATDPARVAGASVTFEPGARTAWHTHPLGQTLLVVAGCGLAQREGGPIEDDSVRRRHLVPARRKALARRYGHHRPDAHRHSGTAQWQDRGVDGKGQRRAISGPMKSGLARLRPR